MNLNIKKNIRITPVIFTSEFRSIPFLKKQNKHCHLSTHMQSTQGLEFFSLYFDANYAPVKSAVLSHWQNLSNIHTDRQICKHLPKFLKLQQLRLRRLSWGLHFAHDDTRRHTDRLAGRKQCQPRCHDNESCYHRCSNPGTVLGTTLR